MPSRLQGYAWPQAQTLPDIFVIAEFEYTSDDDVTSKRKDKFDVLPSEVLSRM